MQKAMIQVNRVQASPKPPPILPRPLVLPSHPSLLLINQVMHVHSVLTGHRRFHVHVGAEKTTRPQVRTASVVQLVV